jgi:16S rRNA (guanine527-N7)-methyltransferase
LKVTLLDSLNKRISFLNEVILQTGLNDIETIHGRAEDFAKPGLKREKYDLCVSRAVANLSTLSEYCLPYVKIGGEFIPYKSGEINSELDEAKGAIFLLGGKVESCCTFELPDSDIHRSLVKIRKVNGCPKKYPRKSGLPGKNPLH